MRVGQYVLLREIARGGMAEIWLARNATMPDFQRELVIKRILSTHEPASRDSNSMFLDEARITAQLHHPNIVQVFDLGLSDGTPYMVMEHLAGESISRLAKAFFDRRQQVPIPLALYIVGQAAEGLGYAHRKLSLDGQPLHIVHRDVSPQNLFVTYEGAVKVLDFGVAKAVGRMTRTATGVFKGKVAYMAPEHAMGRPVDARSDVYSLGVVLFELLTLTRLYGQRNDVAIVNALATDAARPAPSSARSGVPGPVDLLVEQALAGNPADRPADGLVFKAAIDECLGTLEERPTAENLRETMSTLFSARMETLREFLAAARAGVIEEAGTPSRRREAMPAGTLDDSVSGRLNRAPKPALVFGVAAALLLVVGLAFVIRSPRFAVKVSTDPPGAAIQVDGKPAGQSPLALMLKRGPHALAASKEGYVPAALSVDVQGDDTIAMPLEAQPSPPPALGAVQPAPPTPPPSRPSHAAHRIAGTMHVNLETRPWTRVYLGHQLLGETPLVDVPVPAGEVELRLVNEKQHIDTTVSLYGRAGDQLFKKLSF
jgi:serine/threonine-protein kinase